MTCKYFDCGWCYAPEDVENNSKNGSCNEPLFCPYKKSQMTNHEIVLERKKCGGAMDYTMKIFQRLDENTVKIDGVEYQRVEPPKPPTLYDALCEKGGMYSSVCDTVVEIVKEWLPLERYENGDGYNIGWNDCLQHLKENIK
jgi:hypothetical protein